MRSHTTPMIQRWMDDPKLDKAKAQKILAQTTDKPVRRLTGADFLVVPPRKKWR